MSEPAAMIAVNGLKKSFGPQVVLNGVDVKVSKGESVAVLGRSGTGKSVLLKVIVGLQKPDGGSVRIADHELSGMERQELTEVRKKMGFLFQHAALYDSLSVGDNVAFPLVRHTKMSEAERKKKAAELLQSVGIGSGDLDKLPSKISGGMQKRVGLARALALDPEILLCDEPTAGLDPITATEIGELIVKLKQERQVTTVVVTHDLRGARMFADRLLLLNEGRIVAEGDFGMLAASQDEFVSRFFREAQDLKPGGLS